MPGDLPTSQLAFRVAIAAGVLGVVGYLNQPLQMLGGFVLLGIGGLIFFGAVRSKEPRARRGAAQGALVVAGGGALLSGIVAMLALPLVVLAGVCAALGVVAVLGSSEDGSGDEYAP